MTTDDPIEVTMNLHQRIQPIDNHYIIAKKVNIPCSGRVYFYIPSLTFDSQQALLRTKYTMPLATSCRLIKEQQVLNGPYRLSPLDHSPYKTVPSVAFRTLSARRLLPSSLARSLDRSFTPIPSLPSLPSFPTHPVDACAPLAPLRGIPGHSAESARPPLP